MLGDSSTVLGSSSVDAAPAAATEAAAANSLDGGSDVGGGCAGLNSGEEDRNNRGEEGDRSFGGNRWPRQETLALLKIRSDMDVAFRDASVKGPLWEEVSRKLAELGYHRSAKKCKEKFENVYKYHKRTKEGRTGKSDGKTYRFFDQLQALENQPSSFPLSPTSQQQQQHQKGTHQQPASTTMATMPAVAVGGGGGGVAANVVVPSHQNTVPSATHPLMSISSQPSSTTTATATATAITSTINLTFSSFPPTNPTILPPPAPANPISIPSSFYSVSADFVSHYSTSSSTSSDEEQEQEALLEGRRKRKRKWKWKDFFERLMKEVIQKQEDLQKKFLEAIEKREQERAAREEAWRMQEIARINREREILAQERSIAAAKDAAVMAFLQKMSEHQPPHNVNLPPPPQPPPPPPIQPVLAPPVPVPAPAPPPPQVAANSMEMTKANSKAEGENNSMGASSSRWPKMEVQALIKLRTSLDAKYQENGPKGPLWEEISAAMRKIGYNRSSKRCKEKWENINKYFKKVKESNKKRPEDSKTCPYFHQLDALYREKNRFENVSPGQIKPENTIPLMVQPEQQWPPQQDQNNPDSGMESDPMDQNQDEEEDKDEDDEEEEGDGNYELVVNRPPLPSSMSAAE